MAMREFNYESKPTVEIVKEILTDAINYQVSDIHFDPTSNGLNIKFRMDSELVEYTDVPETVRRNIVTRIKILAGMNITETAYPQLGVIKFDLDKDSYSMRTSTIPVVNGEKVVVHLSSFNKGLDNLDNLDISNENLTKIHNLIKKKSGLLLVSGGLASGKTTLLYSIIKELDCKKLNIISIEDPIKIRIDGVNQIELNTEKGITMKSILKTIALQDPDVIVISDLKDADTVSFAVREANKGRLVISSLYTSNVYTTIETLRNMDVEDYLIASSLQGIISLRLVKKLCPSCRKLKKTTDYEKNVIKNVLEQSSDEIFEPVGCDDCRDGYTGMTPLVEVLEFNDELKEAIYNNSKNQHIYDLIYNNIDSMIKDGIKKVVDGDTSFEEVIRTTDISTDLGEYNNDLKNVLLNKRVKLDEVKEEPKKEETPEVKEEVKEEPKEEPKVEAKEEEKKTESTDLSDKIKKSLAIFDQLNKKALDGTTPTTDKKVETEEKKEEPKKEEKVKIPEVSVPTIGAKPKKIAPKSFKVEEKKEEPKKEEPKVENNPVSETKAEVTNNVAIPTTPPTDEALSGAGASISNNNYSDFSYDDYDLSNF